MAFGVMTGSPGSADPDFLEAVLRVLRETGTPLHWTKIQDLALRQGYLDPFKQPNVRRELLAALREGVRTGQVRKEATGVYALGDAPT